MEIHSETRANSANNISPEASNLKPKTKPRRKGAAQTKTQLIYIEGYNALSALKTAVVQDNPPQSLRGIRAVFKRMMKYDHIHLASEIAIELHKYYLKEGNLKEARGIRNKCHELSRLVDLDNRIKLDFQEIAHRRNFNLGRKKELLIDLDSFLGEYKKYLELDCALINHRIYIMLIVRQIMNGEFEEAVNTSQIAGDYFRKREIEKDGVFDSYKAAAFTHLGKHEESRVAISDALRATYQKGSSWAIRLRQAVICELYADRIDLALNHFQKFKDFNSSDVSDDLKEHFLILKAYFAFLSKSGHVQMDKKFRIGKFLNEVQIFSKDKKGTNVNLVILSILHRLDDRGWLIDKAQAIAQYCTDHLRGNKRARTFIRMLLKIERYSFKRQAIENMASKDLKILHDTENERDLDIEIFPYEKLWELALGTLQQKK